MVAAAVTVLVVSAPIGLAMPTAQAATTGAALPAQCTGTSPVIDLTARSEALVESLGPANSTRLFLTAATDGVTDNTHFSPDGATQMADLVVRGIRERGLSLVRFLR